MKRTQSNCRSEHETFLTEREDVFSLFSTNQMSRRDISCRTNLPSGGLVGRKNQYGYGRSVGTLGENATI